ncbi:M48 family metallopeptidase [Pseudoteredinibacter isoporae]|uniref:Zn-dependent protease with chaperone function n=1 Tax=Pseudoteredinibacter isoporae TaxID=570281 RepID=A0A7X0JSA3_9GAMM|nr:M48 family metallopeptidase [Pseudoteredinibacter isoporae]MBB6521382.1 Zn-dependent protease with chaperone function [Pseudoteredinibacter isoporae]NHO86937.1 M48 family metallopeptidase [Pseudoteredinibacter isoporae]NIB24610.1 M48 family metallopeptidase [Pseudoteredinibacter isoporae]
MNFFEHQDRARRNTKKLVLLLLLAVLSLIAITIVLVVFLLNYGRLQTDESIVQHMLNTANLEFIVSVGLGVLAVVSLGSLYKLSQLSSGGKVVAEAMGGRLLNIQTRDADERKILNVVEEMAIAGGTAVPPVYLIDDDSINAFAAGYKGQDAVIGITRGCIQLLNREELQGVIAHEFSHILHGDMRLNIRLVGILHGILLIGIAGYYLMRTAAFSGGSDRRNNGLPFLALGLGLMVIGYSGTFFGNLIKAAVSRQREYLADSSAVQYTRNPFGISGALKKIAAHSQGSLLQNEHAPEFSHMFFGQGVKMAFGGMMATHPPLEDRIRRVEPNWDGSLPTLDYGRSVEEDFDSSDDTEDKRKAMLGAAVAVGAAIGQGGGSSLGGSSVGAGPAGKSSAHQQTQQTQSSIAGASAMDCIGVLSEEHVAEAQNTLAEIPDSIREAAHEPFSARALVYGLLLDADPSVQAAQLQQLKEKAHPASFKALEKILEELPRLDRHLHLPILDLCLPALKQQSPQQYQIFKRNMIILIRADKHVDIFEWALYRIVCHGLEPQRDSLSRYKLKQTQGACQLLISVMARAGHDDEQEALRAYSAAAKELDIPAVGLLPEAQINLQLLDKALEQLNLLRPLDKPRLLKAMAASINHDGEVTATEAELFRAIADSLDCPIPPLLKGQKLV